MKCESCSTVNSDGSRFCIECGSVLEKPCLGCGAKNPSNARFCSACGNAYAAAPTAIGTDLRQPEGELKQVTVLFADVRGSTELIQALDPETAMERLDPAVRLMTEAVERFSGVVNKQQGDGIMALFGVPNACEDHAVRACLAARAMIDGLSGLVTPGIVIRVGLASGNVVVRTTGSDASDFDAMGVTVHVASRLEQLADPGTVQITGQTARLARGYAQIAAMAAVRVKGIDEPVETFRLLNATERPSWESWAATHAQNQFVGREAELLQMKAAMRRAGLGRGQALTLVGDAGLGKSRLVHEFLRSIGAGAWSVLHASATPQTSNAVFRLAADLLRAFVAVNPTDAAADVSLKLDNALAERPGEPPLDAQPLRWLLDLPVEEAEWQELDFVARRQRVVTAMRWIMLRETERQPVLLVIEDYHWADEASIEVLTGIVDGMGASRLMVIVTTRPGRRSAWGTRSYAAEMELMPLEPASAEALLCELLGASESLAPLRAQIIEQADGTPLFLEEIARSLMESGVVTNRPAQTVLTRDLMDVQIPATVQAVLATRIDRLPPVRRRLLQLASVIGQYLPLRLVAAVSDLPEDQLADELLELQNAEFLYEINFAFGRDYTFKHVLTQNVAYESMLRRHRRKLHADVMRAIETIYADRIDEWTERLAYHAIAGEVWDDAASYALKAAKRANHSCAWLDATKLLESAVTALSHLPDSPETIETAIEVRMQLRVAFGALADLPRQRDALSEARELEQRSSNPLRLARIDTSRCLNFTLLGDLEAAIEPGRAAHGVLSGHGEPGGLISSAFALGQAHFFRGEFADALRVLGDTHRHAVEGHDLRHAGMTGTPAVLHQSCLMRTHVMLGDFDRARAIGVLARRAAENFSRPFDLAELGQAEGFLHLVEGDDRQAASILHEALGIARASNSTLLLPIIASALGRALVGIGEIDEAEQLMNDAVALTEQQGFLAMRICCGPALGLVKARRSPEAGRREYLTSLSLARASGFRGIEVQLLRLLGDLSVEQGGDDHADYYAQAESLAQTLGMRPELEAVRARAATRRPGNLHRVS